MQNPVRSRPAAGRTMLLSVALASLCASAVAEECRHGIPPSTPAADFTDHGDGTLTHAATALMWKRCSEGQTWSEAGCEGEAGALAWGEALALAEASEHAGHGDWRLPNVKELVRLVEHCRILPAVNAEIFPATPAGRFWTATPSAQSAGASWYVDFEFGPAFGSGNRSDAMHVRLVREAAVPAPPEPHGAAPQEAAEDPGQSVPDAEAASASGP